MHKIHGLSLYYCIGIILITVSCTNTRKAVYFNTQQDADLLSSTVVPQTIIQKNDLLSISVSSLNPQATAIFNSPNISYASTSAAGTNAPSAGVTLLSSGYLVDAEGYIQFPVLGNIKAEGITDAQLRQVIIHDLLDKKLLIDPIVSIRYLNFKVTVMGEVNRPAVINVPSEKISLMEALGLAGDITIYGKKDNVMIIREEQDKKIIRRINLNSNELFNSSYYYLKSNDIVYVEPNRAKVASSTRTNQLLPIILSGLSFVAIIVDRVTR